MTNASPAPTVDAFERAAFPVTGEDGSQQAILQAVVRAATVFLRTTDLDDGLDALLAGIGTATHASRAYVFRNELPAAGAVMSVVQCAEWTAPGIVAQMSSRSIPHMGLGAAGPEEWHDAFASGAPFVAVVAELPDAIRDQLRDRQILSLAAAPIFADDDFWGFIGVDNCVTARRWSPLEVEALSTAAAVVGAAISRRRMESLLRDASVQALLAADIGEVVTRAGGSVQQMLDSCTAAIMNRIRPDFVRVWMMSATLECLHTCQAAGAVVIQAMDSEEMPLVCEELARIAQSDAATSWDNGLPELWPGCEAVYEQHALRAGVGFRLMTSGRVAGVIIMLGREYPERWMISALESVTDEIALAIERHHGQVALERAEARYRRLVGATIEGIVIHDGERVVDANPSFAKMVGYTMDEIIGIHPFLFIGPEYHPLVREHLLAGYEEPYEVEGVGKDGTRFPVELKATVFLDGGRKLRVATVRDLTDRKASLRAAQLLREEQDARALAERTHAQAQFLGEASRILASSLDTTTTLKQLGRLAIPTLADYCVVSTFEEGLIQRVAVVHGDPDCETLLRDAVAAWPATFTLSNPIFAALSSNTYYLARDVTEETLLELAVNPGHLESLRGLAPRSLLAVPISNAGVVMGSMIMSFTRPDRLYGPDDVALAEQFANRAALALQSARSFLRSEAATRSRDEMLAVVAHDLRNPLNTIFMGSELALEMSAGDSDSAGQRQLHIIRRSAEHMNRLIQDLLDASRLDSGTLVLEQVSLRPADLLREAQDMLAPLASHENIALQFDVAADLPSMNADRGRLMQVLSNLIGNALKFTPSGGAIIVSAVREDCTRAEGHIRFSVQDTGPGIPADLLPHIFARGWQATRGDKRGIGLGLAIASGIVQAHNGRIWAESRVGEGSTFLFTVPVGSQVTG